MNPAPPAKHHIGLIITLVITGAVIGYALGLRDAKQACTEFDQAYGIARDAGIALP